MLCLKEFRSSILFLEMCGFVRSKNNDLRAAAAEMASDAEA